MLWHIVEFILMNINDQNSVPSFSTSKSKTDRTSSGQISRYQYGKCGRSIVSGIVLSFRSPDNKIKLYLFYK